MNINFKQLIKKNFIFLFIFNSLFFILLLFFFNNVSNGKVYILDIKVSFIKLVKNNNNSVFKDIAHRHSNPFTYFREEIDKLDLYKNKIITNLYHKENYQKEFVLKFYTYDDSINKQEILKIYNNIFNNVSMKMNNNFNEILNNSIKDDEFYLTTMQDFLNVVENIKINEIFNNMNLVINNQINEYRNQLELNKNISSLKKFYDEGFDISNIYDFVHRIDELAFKKDLFSYLNANNQNTMYDIKIKNFNERNIFMDKFSYLFIFFGILISIMISLLFLIYVNNRELKAS